MHKWPVITIHRSLFAALTFMYNNLKSIFLKKEKLSQLNVKQSTVFFYER